MSPINHLHKGRVDELLATGKITSQQHAEMVELLSQDPLKTQRGQRPRTHGEKPDNFYSRLIFGLLLTVIALVFLLFTPYTHQLDEIKTALLFAATPFLLILALCDFDFQELSRRSSRPLIFLGLFAFSGILSMLLNLSNWQLAERAWWFHFAAISLCGVTAVLVNSVERVRLAMRFFVCLGLASALIGFAMYGGTLEPLYGLMKNSTWGGRSSWTTLLYVLLQSDVMYSTILANDFYSIFLAMTLPLSVGLFVVERTRAWKATAALAFITMSLALPRTRDFIGIATAAAVSLPLAAYLIYRICNRADGGRGLAPQANLVLAACGAVILMILLPKLNSNDPWLFRAVDYRPVIWSGAIAVWLFGGDASHAALDWKSILAGNGPGGFRFHFPLHRRPDFFDHGVNNVTTYAHNYYLDILCEQGIIGIVVFGAMIWFMLRAAWRQIHRDTSLDAQADHRPEDDRHDSPFGGNRHGNSEQAGHGAGS